MQGDAIDDFTYVPSAARRFRTMSSISANRLSSCLRRILPARVSVAALDVEDVDISALPDDLILDNAGAKRQRQYAAGRLAAWQAIEACGHAPVYPAKGNDREPLWPQGLVGSISHTDYFALAAATGASTAASLGIDLEALHDLRPGLPEKILTSSELSLLRSTGSYTDESVLKLFSFKECVYKAVYPVFGRYVGFREVEITPADDGLRARCADSAHPAAGLVNRLRGDALVDGDYVIAGCWMT